jgi:hypothetical protein
MTKNIAMKVFLDSFPATLACCLLLGNLAPVLSQTNKSTCSFNARKESCTVNPWANGDGSQFNLAITWLSDGKQTFYAFNRGNVMIIEDNGRPTSGNWYREGKNLVVTSSRGNVTVIPW